MSFARDRDLYKTKLCTLFLQRGHCPRQSCSFAHGDAELRRMPGRFDGRGGNDLRSRFERQSSVDRSRRSHSRERRGRGSNNSRRSPQRDRGQSRSPAKRRRSRSVSPPQSPQYKRRDNKTFRSEANDTHLSDVSAENIGTDGADSDKRDDKVQLRSVSPTVRDALEEQLGELQGGNKELLEQKLKLELVLEGKLHETTELSDKITFLERKLVGANEDCKGFASRTKKLVKVYKGFVRAQEDLKKAQGKLMKLVVEDVTGDTKVDIDLESMKAVSAHLANHESILEGTRLDRKLNNGDTISFFPQDLDGRPLSGSSQQQFTTSFQERRKASGQKILQQYGTTRLSDEAGGTPTDRKVSNVLLSFSGNEEPFGQGAV